MVFGSVGECIAYIEAAIQDCMPPLSIEIKRVMDEVTLGQVRGWSGQIFSSVMPSSGGMSAEASFEDTGNWYSLITGQSVGNPIKFLEVRSVQLGTEVQLALCQLHLVVVKEKYLKSFVH